MISITADQMKKVDELVIEKYEITLEQMMELAGSRLALLAKKLLNKSLEKKKVIVLAGRGNNGGGGLLAARHMNNMGAKVTAVISQRSHLKDSVKHQIRTLKLLTDVLFFNEELDIDQLLANSELIIDSLIGYNISGNPRYPVSKIIESANRSKKSILSLDLPSGLDATTGKIYKPCITAENTLTLALPKKGLMTDEARLFVGNLYLTDIGIPPSLYGELGISIGNIFKEKSTLKIF